MKKIIVLLLVLSLSFSLVSCGKSNDATQNTENTKTQTEISTEVPITNDAVVPEEVVFSLDTEYQQDMNEAYSNYDKCVINDEYALLWQEKADEYYDTLISYYSSDEERFNDRYISPEDMLENVQSMKNDRRSYIEKQIEFYEAHLISKYGPGSILPVILSEYILDMYRAEALEVYQMCIDLHIDVDAP
jgi:hypothetical protein